MYKYLRFIILFLLIANQSTGQTVYQSVRGIVMSQSGMPLPGAGLFLSDKPQTIAITDSGGTFRMHDVLPGRYTLSVRYIGYHPLYIPLLVEAGKEVVIETRLNPNTFPLQAIEVTPKFHDNQKAGTRVFTVEETKRYAAVYNDPARLVTSFPGVINQDDQANNVVIRGNSPNGVQWRLEGVDIVNPNHLDNAGTFTDRASQNGGGVNILSAQLLGNSELIKGAYNAEYGNAVSGVFNMRLRKGNNERTEFTGQLSLLGTDIAAEGPFSKNKKASYLINYRYSTIGLLSMMGVNFGDEKITYQDLSFNFSFPTVNAGTFTLFGMGGKSSNIFKAKKDSALWEYSKDRYNIDFFSDMGAIGATHKYVINSKFNIKTSAAISAKEINRKAEILGNNYVIRNLQSDELSIQKTSVHTALVYFPNNKNTITTGFYLNQTIFKIFNTDAGEKTSPLITAKGEGQYLLYQPYLDWKSSFNDKFGFTAGVHYVYLDLTKSQHIEPRLSLFYDLGDKNTVNLAFDWMSQVQPLNVYYMAMYAPEGVYYFPNQKLRLTKSAQYSLAITGPIGSSFIYKIEPYSQVLFNVPVSADPRYNFSTLNTLESYPPNILLSRGSGKNKGIEFMLEKPMASAFYFLLSTTFYQSTFMGIDSIEHYSRYNGKFALNLTTGKEFYGKKNRSYAVNVRSVYRGGYLEAPIDIALSEQYGKTVYQYGSQYTVRLADYFRVDLRLSTKKERLKYTGTIALDIQNVTNHPNDAYHYYDTMQKKILIRKQLGIIPVLSYRVEFSARRKTKPQ